MVNGHLSVLKDNWAFANPSLEKQVYAPRPHPVYPSLIKEQADLVAPKIFSMLLCVSSWLWFSTALLHEYWQHMKCPTTL